MDVKVPSNRASNEKGAACLTELRADHKHSKSERIQRNQAGKILELMEVWD